MANNVVELTNTIRGRRYKARANRGDVREGSLYTVLKVRDTGAVEFKSVITGQGFICRAGFWEQLMEPLTIDRGQDAEVIRITDDWRFWRNLEQTPGEALLRANMRAYKHKQAKHAKQRKSRNGSVER